MKGQYAIQPQPLEKKVSRRKITQARAPRLLLTGRWEWNLATKAYSWCEEMYRIFKLPARALPPRTGTFLNCVHPDDRLKVVKALGQALVGTKPYNLNHRIVCGDGSVCLVHGEAQVEFDPEGRPVQIRGTIQDITGLKWEESFSI